MAAIVQEIVIDCSDPGALSLFWARLLGVKVGRPDDDWALVAAEPVVIAFQKVPEPKSSPKNRLHLDVKVDDVDAATAHAERLGARVIRPFEGEGDSGFVVLQDPEGNEFCFVTDPSGSWAQFMVSSLHEPDEA